MLGFAIIGQALNCCNIINSDQGNSCITHKSSKKQSNAANGCKKDTPCKWGECSLGVLWVSRGPHWLDFLEWVGILTSSNCARMSECVCVSYIDHVICCCDLEKLLLLYGAGMSEVQKVFCFKKFHMSECTQVPRPYFAKPKYFWQNCRLKCHNCIVFEATRQGPNASNGVSSC